MAPCTSGVDRSLRRIRVVERDVSPSQQDGIDRPTKSIQLILLPSKPKGKKAAKTAKPKAKRNAGRKKDQPQGEGGPDVNDGQNQGSGSGEDQVDGVGVDPAIIMSATQAANAAAASAGGKKIAAIIASGVSAGVVAGAVADAEE